MYAAEWPCCHDPLRFSLGSDDLLPRVTTHRQSHQSRVSIQVQWAAPQILQRTCNGRPLDADRLRPARCIGAAPQNTWCRGTQCIGQPLKLLELLCRLGSPCRVSPTHIRGRRKKCVHVHQRRPRRRSRSADTICVVSAYIWTSVGSFTAQRPPPPLAPPPSRRPKRLLGNTRSTRRRSFTSRPNGHSASFVSRVPVPPHPRPCATLSRNSRAIANAARRYEPQVARLRDSASLVSRHAIVSGTKNARGRSVAF